MRRAVAAAVVALSLAAPGATIAQTDEQLQREKLELERDKLRQDTGTEARIRPYLPLASVVAALVAAGFGAWRYRSDRKLERALRIEEGIIQNLDHLVAAPSAASASGARAVAALRNLGVLTATTEGADQQSTVTETLWVLVVEDLAHLDTPEKAAFLHIALDGWPPYAERLRAEEDVRRRVLDRHIAQLSLLHSRSAPYFHTLTLTGDGEYASPETAPEPAVRRLFAALVTSYVRHVELGGAAGRDAAKQALAQALNNAGLADQILPEPAVS